MHVTPFEPSETPDLAALIDGEEPKPANPYREASMRYLEIVTTAATYIAESPSPTVAAWAVIYALGLPSAEGVSLTCRAEQLGVGVAALSKQVRIIQRRCNVEESLYSNKKDNR